MTKDSELASQLMDSDTSDIQTVEELRAACQKYIKDKDAIYISIWIKHKK